MTDISRNRNIAATARKKNILNNKPRTIEFSKTIPGNKF